MDGRVKTLHPRLYAGLLARRDDEGHLRGGGRAGDRAGRPRVRQPLSVRADASPAATPPRRRSIENIDIGGPTMIRAAAKNQPFAAVVVDPGRLRGGPRRAARLRRAACRSQTRAGWPRKAFACTARYDAAIATWFARAHRARASRRALGERLREGRPTCATARTPTSSAAFYARVGRAHAPARRASSQLHGKELSFNNLLDLSAARELVEDFDAPGLRDRQAQQPLRLRRRRAASRGLRAGLRVRPAERLRRRDRAQPRGRSARRAERLSEQFIEVLLAPGFDAEALELLTEKKNVRLLELARLAGAEPRARGQAGARRAAACRTATSVTESARADARRSRARSPARSEWARPAVRLEGLPARALERDRDRARPARRSASAPGR